MFIIDFFTFIYMFIIFLLNQFMLHVVISQMVCHDNFNLRVLINFYFVTSTTTSTTRQPSGARAIALAPPLISIKYMFDSEPHWTTQPPTKRRTVALKSPTGYEPKECRISTRRLFSFGASDQAGQV